MAFITDNHLFVGLIRSSKTNIERLHYFSEKFLGHQRNFQQDIYQLKVIVNLGQSFDGQKVEELLITGE
jgi:hypothetical protein